MSNQPLPAHDAAFALHRRLVDHVHELPVLEHETVQLGRGAGAIFARQALGRDVTLFQNLILEKMVATTVLDPTWIAFMLPLSWRGDYLFNGAVARPTDVFVTGESGCYTTVGEDRNTVIIGVRRSRLTRAMRALSGDAEARPPPDSAMQLTRMQYASLRHGAMAALSVASPHPLGDGRFILRPTLESDLVSDLAALALCQPAANAGRDPGRIAPDRIVRDALRAHDARRHQGVSLAELCDASGVGQTWLSKCFRDSLGISPVAYLRARRLSMARARLLDRVNPPVSVKDVALSLGFMNLGRFAADYRALFEENPSDTIATVVGDKPS